MASTGRRRRATRRALSDGAARSGGPAPIHGVKAEFFRTLGHPARVRTLELLRDGERTVGQLQRELGLDSSGTSQHLAALRKQGLVEGRREGTSVYYRVKDPRAFQLLEVARQILTGHFEDTRAIFGELAQATPAPSRRGARR